jgi:TatD DNase family protein
MTSIIDIHTHHLDADRALISVAPQDFNPQPGKWYSVGFHPWHEIDQLTDEDFELLDQCAQHRQVLAIGETGMDRTRGAELDIQAAVFVRHLQIAHDLGKPVVTHCVRTAQDILAVRGKAHLDDVPLIIHGMRSNVHVARTLLDGGCFLSFGPRFNSETLNATPLDRLLIETDEAPVTILEVASLVAQASHLTTDQVISQASANACRILGVGPVNV